MDERKPLPNVEGMFTLKVDGISHRITVDMLKDKFGAFGEVGDVYIPRQYGSSEPRGFAFVRFANREQAEEAQRALDGTELEERTLRIQEAKERRPENPRSAMMNRDRRRSPDRHRSPPRRDSRDRDRRRDRSPPPRERSRDRDYRGRGDREDRDYRRGDRERGGDRDRDRERDRGDRDRSRDRSYHGRH